MMHAPKSYALIMLSLIACLRCGQDESMTAFKNVHLVPMTEEKIF